VEKALNERKLKYRIIMRPVGIDRKTSYGRFYGVERVFKFDDLTSLVERSAQLVEVEQAHHVEDRRSSIRGSIMELDERTSKEGRIRKGSRRRRRDWK
jgi:hypothetical protein